MTTSTDPASSTPTEPESTPSELSEIWRAIGRLEGTANTLLEGQRQLKEGQEQLKATFQAEQQESRAEFKAEQQESRAEFKAEQQESRAEFKAEQQESRTDFKADLREVNRRVDRLFYAILGIGGASMVSIYASRFIGS